MPHLVAAHRVLIGTMLLCLSGCGGVSSSDADRDSRTGQQAGQKTPAIAKPAVVAQKLPLIVGPKADKSATISTTFGLIRVDEFDIANGSHADGGRLSVAYAANGKIYPRAVEGGSFGQFGDWSIDRTLTDYPVVVSHSGGTWQGYTCSWLTLTELRPDGPVTLATIEESFDDGGAVSDGSEPESSQGRIVSVKRNRSFAMQFKGTTQFTAEYRRTGNHYVLQGGDDRTLQGC